MKYRRILFELRNVWALIRLYHPEVPEVEFKIVATHQNYTAAVKGRTITVTTHALDWGVDTILGSLLHEAAHLICTAHKIEDQRDKDYHTKEWLAVAEELGLRGYTTTDSIYGHSTSMLTESTRRRYSRATSRLRPLVGENFRLRS